MTSFKFNRGERYFSEQPDPELVQSRDDPVDLFKGQVPVLNNLTPKYETIHTDEER